MLYKGADLIRDVEFVIFDEVHYVNDAEVIFLSVLLSCRVRLEWPINCMTYDSAVWYGKRSSSCCQTTLTSSYSPQLCPTQKNSQIGSGAYL